jgi:hypothetical protein
MSRKRPVSELLARWRQRREDLRMIAEFFRGRNHDCELWAKASDELLARCIEELTIVNEELVVLRYSGDEPDPAPAQRAQPAQET